LVRTLSPLASVFVTSLLGLRPVLGRVRVLGALNSALVRYASDGFGLHFALFCVYKCFHGFCH